jgi:protoporphyrinogen oxidase
MIADRTSSAAVIGGGVAGLVAAYRLLQRGHRVRIFEAEPSLGGLVRTFEAGGERLECFYHHLFTSDGAAIRLLDELTLLKTLTWRRSTMGVFYEGRVYPFTTALDLLRFTPLLGIRDRIRLGLVALRLRRERDGSQFENVTAVEWMGRHAGQRCLEVVWEPLLRGKFGDMADQVPMTWLWNRLRLRFSSRGLLSQTEVLGYQLGSFAVWIEAIVKLIRALGGEIATRERVVRISREDGRLRVDTAGGRQQYFESVIATISSGAFLRIAPPLGDSYSDSLQDVAYQDALCLVLSLKQALGNFYWLNINDRTLPFLAVVEHTNLIEPERYRGEHIVYISNYVGRESPLLQMTCDELFSLYLPHLKRINPAFDESWVNARWLFHGADAQPVFTLGAASRVPDHHTPVPGLYLSNMAQLYPQDRGQNYSILLGENIAELVASDLSLAETSQDQDHGA